MNEIDPKSIRGDQPPVSPKRPELKRPSGSSSASFKDLLDKTSLKNRPGGVSSAPAALQEIQGTFRAQALKSVHPSTDLMTTFEESMALLDRYASWLGRPDKTLKQAHGILEQLLTKSEDLNRQAKSDSSIDSDVAGMINQFRTIVLSEQIKFDRGDYTP